MRRVSGVRDLRLRAESAGLSLLFRLVRMLPLDVATRLSAGIWRFVGPWRRRHRRALRNLKVAFPEASEEQRERIARAMWANMGRIVAEALMLDRILAQPDRIEVRGRNPFEMHMRQPGPNIGVTLHMGNWELAVWPCTACGGNPAGVYRPLANPYLDRLLREQRRQLYPAGLFGKGQGTGHGRGQSGHSTARLIIDHVRRGGRLAFVCDEVDRRGIPVPFFGRPAKFAPVPAMIARHVGARIWMVRVLRIGSRSRFRIDIEELDVQRTYDRDADVRATTAAIYRRFEAWIREAPEQWMWWNTRWLEDERIPVDHAPRVLAAGSTEC
jgi:KDO2-lipid IV(A) lauroyltransferase